MYWPADTKKILDLIYFFVITEILTNYFNIEEIHDFSSDHLPIILTLCDTIIKKQISPFLMNKKTNWEEFTVDLEDLIDLQLLLRWLHQLEEELDCFFTNL